MEVMALPEIIQKLLEHGVHFGHLSKHWNPKMKKFIFGKKKNVYIIDLEKTVKNLERAKEFVKDIAKRGGKILFVGTKKQLQDTIKELASSCQMPYIVERWVGGFLTNFVTIKERIKKYMELKEKKEKGEFDKLPHKEVVRLNRELERMEKLYSGVTTLEDLPECIYVVDPKRENTCIREASRLSIPVVALIDTDSDPEVIDYPIPGNDDAIRSVGFITQLIVEAILEGKRESPLASKEEKKEGDEPDVEKPEELEEKIIEEEKEIE
ncbi:MAG: 30S ribosomal protein S2 [Candidatus Omnitrophota bacterium]|nr:MAG: 30S ribosomal protein S2 [Candidatus Omnitrophota bacterium]